jgi:thioredoxin 1
MDPNLIRRKTMPLVNLTEENFEQEVDKYDIAVLDFWAPWCGPCRSFAPIFEKVAQEYPDILFGKINTEEQQGLAGFFQIQSIPTIVILREKIGVFQQPGMLPEEALKELVEKVKSLDMDEVREEVKKQQQQEQS